MKRMLKKMFVGVGMAFALWATSCTSTSKGLTASQKVGAGYSPAALFQVSIEENAKDCDVEEIVDSVKNNLQVAGGFTFVDENRVSEVCENTIEKIQKKNSRKNVTDAIFGKKSVYDAITFDAYEGIDSKDIFAALKKELKCEYFVKVQVTAGVVDFRKVEGFEDPVKPAAETAVYIYNKNNELEKQIHAIVALPLVDKAKLQDKSEITNLFPDLIEKSIVLAAENLNKKDKLFEINIIKAETLEIVSSDRVPPPISTFK